MRENLREKDKLRDYLEKHPYNMAYKFVDSADLDPGVYYEPMRNYLDVSVAGRGQGQGQGWLSREPPRALAKGWRSSGGGSRNAKAGVLQGETLENRDGIPRGEGTSTLNSWSMVTRSSPKKDSGKKVIERLQLSLLLTKLPISSPRMHSPAGETSRT